MSHSWKSFKNNTMTVNLLKQQCWLYCKYHLGFLIKSSPSSVCRSWEGKASNNGQEAAKTRSQERLEYLLSYGTRVIHFISVAFPNFPSHILTELTRFHCIRGLSLWIALQCFYQPNNVFSLLLVIFEWITSPFRGGNWVQEIWVGLCPLPSFKDELISANCRTSAGKEALFSAELVGGKLECWGAHIGRAHPPEIEADTGMWSWQWWGLLTLIEHLNPASIHLQTL